MIAKPIKTLELHYLMIQFLIKTFLVFDVLSIIVCMFFDAHSDTFALHMLISNETISLIQRDHIFRPLSFAS